MTTEQDSATAAFERLRAEIGGMRTDMHRLAGEIARQSVPDYDLTLGDIVKRVDSVKDTLSDLKSQLPGPMARLPGESELSDELRKLIAELSSVAAAGQTSVAAMRNHQAWRLWLAGGVASGVAVGIVLSLAVAVLFPEKAGALMAGGVLGKSPWETGEALLQQAGPASYARMVRLFNACPPESPTEMCEAALAVGLAIK
jgi:hypothetical protein